MRKALVIALVVCLGMAPLLTAADPMQDSSYTPYTPDQLDNLLAPIALYPDPLLAQVLLAAIFVDEIDESARWVRANGESGIDDQPWDVSVRAVAHYPSVLNMMDANLDWTTAVGQAYAYQSTDVMASIQRLRAMAYAQGNLVTNPQWQVVDQDGYVEIWPADAQYIYVPIYDPTVIYFQPGYAYAVSFSIGFAIGVWLNLDCDWNHRRIFYTGWRGGGWIARSRPYIHVSDAYVNNRYANITVNHSIISRAVNISNLSSYNNVHRDAAFTSAARGTPVINAGAPVNNRIINSNINTGDASLNQFRGREPEINMPPSAARAVPQPYHPARQPQQARPMAPTTFNPFTGNAGNFNAHAESERGQSSRGQTRPPPAQFHSTSRRPPSASREQP